MTALQNKRIAALEKATPAPMEPITIIDAIIRPDLSVECYLLDTPSGLVELAPDDPLIKDYEPVTPEVNGGFRLSDWIEMGHTPNG